MSRVVNDTRKSPTAMTSTFTSKENGFVASMAAVDVVGVVVVVVVS